MKKKHNLSNQSESKQAVAKLPLPLPSRTHLPALKEEMVSKELGAISKSAHMQTVQSLTEAVMATLPNKKAVPAYGTEAEQSLSRLESLALAEALNYRRGATPNSPSVTIYEQETADKTALPELLQTAEAISNLEQQEAKQAKIAKLNSEESKMLSKKAKKLKPLLKLAFDDSLARPLEKTSQTNSAKTKPQLAVTQLDQNSLAEYLSSKQTNEIATDAKPDLILQTPRATEQTHFVTGSAKKQKNERVIFAKANPDDLLFKHETQSETLTSRRGMFVKASLALFKNWHNNLLPKKDADDWQENNPTGSQTKKKHTVADLASAYLLLTAVCLIVAYLLWAILPGSFLTVYKTQVSGYVLKTIYRDIFCFLLPAYLVMRRYKLKQTFMTQLVGQTEYKVATFVLMPLIAIMIACLLTASNRLLVMHIFAKLRVEILEAPFLILNVGNRQSFILQFACVVILASIVETLCLCGLYLTALKVHFSPKKAVLLCALLWPFLYVSEIDFVSLFIFAFLLAYFRQVSDNIYLVIALNIMVKASLLLERWLLPSMVQRNSVSYSASQAMTLVDILLIAVCSLLLYYLFALTKRSHQKQEKAAKKSIYKQAAELLVNFTADVWQGKYNRLTSLLPLYMSYVILILHYVLYWYFS